MQQPLVSIIIVNYDGKELLRNCFNSLSKIIYSNIEVILVDNNSTDDSVKFTQENFPKTIIVKLDNNKGFAEPNNIAAKIAKGKYLLFLNNDTIVTENFVTEMINVIEKNEKIAICQSLLLKPNGHVDSSGDFIDKLGIVYNSKSKISIVREISSARGASMLMRKKVFNELDGFDEKFFVSFEDVDLGWRSWILGYSAVLVPTSIVYHIGGSTIKKIKSDIAFHGFKNQLSMKITNFELNYMLSNLFKFFVIYGIRELKIWWDYKKNGSTQMTPTDYETKIANKPNFKIIFKSIIWILKNPIYLINKYKKINSNRKLSTQKLIEMNLITNKKQ